MITVGSIFTVETPPPSESVGGVYKLVNLTNGKIYVGSTKNFKRRFQEYKSKRKPKQSIHHAILKYGFEQFTFQVLEIVDNIDKLSRQEQYWMDLLNPFNERGYNVHPQAWARGALSKDGKNKVGKAARHYHSRSIYQIDIDSLQIIEQFPSAIEAGKRLGKTSETIGQCANHKEQTAYGFYWRWKKEYDQHGFVVRQRRNELPASFYLHIKPVRQIDVQGNVIKTWGSLTDVVEAFGWDRKSMTECCNKSNRYRKTAYGYKWEWVTDSNEIEMFRLQRFEKYEAFKSSLKQKCHVEK